MLIQTFTTDYEYINEGYISGHGPHGEPLWDAQEASTLNPDDDSGQWLFTSLSMGVDNFPVWLEDVDQAIDYALRIIKLYEVDTE